MWNAWTEKVGVTSAVTFTRADQVTASVPATDVVEPPSVTSLKTLPPRKPLTRLPSLNEPLTSVPHESLFARFLKLIVVTSRPSTMSSVLMMKRMTLVVCR